MDGNGRQVHLHADAPEHRGQSLPLVPAWLELQLPQWRGVGRSRAVTPYVIEYGSDYPATYALLLLPLYVGAGRIKNQAHWQTDVLAGWTVGGLSGWFAHSLDVPIMIRLLPHGFEVGYSKQF